jgi:hypothetical protein
VIRSNRYVRLSFLQKLFKSDKVICPDCNDLGTTVSGYSHPAGGLGGIGHPGTGIEGYDYQGIGPNPF